MKPTTVNRFEARLQRVADHLAAHFDEPLSMIVQGDRVAVLFRSRGSAGGEAFELPIAAFITVSGGRIVRDRSVFQPPSATCSP